MIDVSTRCPGVENKIFQASTIAVLSPKQDLIRILFSSWCQKSTFSYEFECEHPDIAAGSLALWDGGEDRICGPPSQPFLRYVFTMYTIVTSQYSY